MIKVVSRALVMFVLTSAHSQIHFTARLDGSQENPPVSTTATGTGSFTLSSDLTTLKWTVSYQGLSGVLTAGGHFHTGSVGSNGPVVKSIASSGGAASATISGTWTSTDAAQPLTRALAESLLTGRLYVNFHTSANSGGEIRGQLNLATGLHFTANLTGGQQNPPVSTTAGGTGAFTLNPSRNELRWGITYRGLSGTLTGGHFHAADSGRNGSVVKGISTSGDPASATIAGVWRTSDATQPLTQPLIDSLVSGKLYVNFHTAANPGGEVRGQLRLNGGIGFVARLSGAQENPPVPVAGSGTGSFSLNDARTELKYDLTYIGLTGTLTGGHFHAADSGRNGPVVRGVTSTGDPAAATIGGVWRSTDGSPLTSALAESLLTGRIYFNLHTASNPSGEVRGQVQLTTGIGFTSRLSGSQENPPVSTNGSATGAVFINARRDTIRYDVTYHGLSSGLSSAGGHFHAARRGANGSVVRNIAAGSGPASGSVAGIWSTLDATQTLTRALVDSLVAQKLYVNFHTPANTGGEIRGQVEFGSDAVTSVKREDSAIPAEFSLGQNYPNPFNPETIIPFSILSQSTVQLRVFDILGQEVQTLVDETLAPGSYSFRFDGARVASGVYFYSLRTGSGFSEIRRMMLMK